VHCRFQYLELAYYLAHGRCIGLQDPGDSGLILKAGDNFSGACPIVNGECPQNSTLNSAEPQHDDTDHSQFNEFLRNSSEELNVQTAGVSSMEFSFSSRVMIAPGYTDEHRVFIYSDEKVTKLHIPYFSCRLREPCILLLELFTTTEKNVERIRVDRVNWHAGSQDRDSVHAVLERSSHPPTASACSS
jgi:hypothetical protein